MNRRTLIQSLATLAILPMLPACARTTGKETLVVGADRSPGAVTMLDHSDSYWRDKVGPAEYAILFKDGTEPAFSSPLNKEKREGTFVCAACNLPLFKSEAKFESGTGWPSFTKPIAGHIGTKKDFKMILPRTEYHCARCGGHQGHVFNDGPAPRGERWCNNGLALDFVLQGEPLPALRG